MIEAISNVFKDYTRQTVNLQSYTEFEKYWLLYEIAGKRYGQAFCEHFGISQGTPLYYFADDELSKRWIKDNHIKNENTSAEIY